MCFIAYETVMDNSTNNVIDKLLKAFIKNDISCYSEKVGIHFHI